MNPTNDPAVRSWVSVPPESHFPIQNLPYGTFLRGGASHVGVAIGSDVLDLPGRNVLAAAPDAIGDAAVENQVAGSVERAAVASEKRTVPKRARRRFRIVEVAGEQCPRKIGADYDLTALACRGGASCRIHELYGKPGQRAPHRAD